MQIARITQDLSPVKNMRPELNFMQVNLDMKLRFRGRPSEQEYQKGISTSANTTLALATMV